MKKQAKVSGLLLFIFSIMTHHVQSMSCDKPVFDFGTISDREVYHCTFILTNDTDSIVIIDRIRTGCSCTQHKMDSPVIPPGESKDLAITFDPRNRSGEQVKKIYIITRNNSTPLELTIKAIVSSPIWFSPQTVIVSGPSKEMFEKQVAINFSEPSEIIGTRVDSEKVAVYCTDVSAQKIYLLKVSGAIPEEGSSLMIRVVTSNKNVGDFTIPLRFNLTNK